MPAWSGHYCGAQLAVVERTRRIRNNRREGDGMNSTELVHWAHGLTLGAIPTEVQHSATRHLLDGIGNAIAARRTRGAIYGRTERNSRANEPRFGCFGVYRGGGPNTQRTNWSTYSTPSPTSA